MNEPLPLATRLAAFRFSQPIMIRFNDFDLLGHVNNAVYLTYCESGRLHYWGAATASTQITETTQIVAHASLDYRRPVRWGDTVRVVVRTSAIGRTSYTSEYLVLGSNAEGEYLAAEGRSVQVMYDYANGRSVPMPDDARAALEAFEGGPLGR